MKLVIEDDEGHRREVPLDREEVTIGRREDNVVHLPERNVSRQHARLLRQGDTVLLEDLQSSNGTHVNGTRISEQVPLADGDTVRIGDYGVAVRPDHVPLEAPLPWTVAAEPQAFPRTDVLADTAPHPVVVTAAEPAIEVQLADGPPHRPRRVLAVVGIGLLLGLGGALVLRERSGDAARARARNTVPPPPTPEVVVDEVLQPPAAVEPPTFELTPPTVPASRPSTATEWLAAARAAAEAREFDRALRMLGSVHDGAFQAEVQTLRRTWRAEAAAGRAVKSARKELDRGRPGAALKALEGARATRAWAPEVSVLRTEAAAALKGSRKTPSRAASAADLERLYREGKALYDAGSAGEAAGLFERCVTLDKNHPRCHLMLATSYARGGDTGRAETHYRRFLALASPDDPAVPRVKKFLEDSDAQKKARASSAMPER